MIWGLDTNSSDGPFAISSAPGEHPATDGQYVVWSTPDTADNADIMGYDLSSGKEFTICDDAGAQLHPAVSDGVVVWQDDRNGNWDIYGATIDCSTDTAGPATPVCTADGDRPVPDVYCGFAVFWQDDRNGNADIYGTWLGGDQWCAGKLVRGQLIRGKVGSIRTASSRSAPPPAIRPTRRWPARSWSGPTPATAPATPTSTDTHSKTRPSSPSAPPPARRPTPTSPTTARSPGSTDAAAASPPSTRRPGCRVAN